MQQESYTEIIQDQTRRALWEAGNIIDCVPDDGWDAPMCGVPIWKHIYHMLHSLDLWFIDPRDTAYEEPAIHQPGMNDLDIPTEKGPDRQQMMEYLHLVDDKISAYVDSLTDSVLLECPGRCEYTRFTLVLAQFRHLHTHMGMIMGHTVLATGKWPRVIGLEGRIPDGEYEKYV